MQRRQLLTAAGGIVAGGTAVTLTSSEPARADVTFGNLDVSDRTYEQSSELQNVSIRVNANYKFDCGRIPDRWELILKVGEPNGELTQIAETRMAPSSKADSGTEEISGSVLDGPFGIEQFRIDGAEETVSMAVGLTYRVVHNEQEVASASVQDTTQLTVTPGSVDGSANLKGTGEIVLSR